MGIVQVLALIYDNSNNSVMGVMKMGNTAPRAGVEPTSLAFWASVLPVHHIGSLMFLLYPHPPVYVALLPQRSVQTTILIPPGIVSLLMLTINGTDLYIYTYTG